MPLFKGKGEPASMKNRRPLTISDHAGKVAARICKRATEEAYEKWLQQMQCGCRKGLGTDIANLLVRSFIDKARMGAKLLHYLP